MKKIYLVIGVITIVMIGILTILNFTSNNLEKTLEEAKSLNSYQLTANMEMLENDELKSYLVTVTYEKEKKDGQYKVELYDKSLNQSQIIIRNNEGVHVVTPSLNQVFKFQSDWPMNSPKPYIYESLLLAFENGEVEKIKDGYHVKESIKYPNDNRVKSQEIIFDQNLNPQQVLVYDKEEVAIVTVEVVEFKENKKIDKDCFNVEKTLETAISLYEDTSVSLPMYPVTNLGSNLDSVEVSSIEGNKSHILKFVGDKSYTMIQSIQQKLKTVQKVTVEDEVIDLIDGFALYDNNRLTRTMGNIKCTIYSNELSKDEMIQIVNSIQVAIIK